MTLRRLALPLLAALTLGLAVSGSAVSGSTAAPTPPRTLVLYATSGPWGRWGEIYAAFTANLAGRFGTFDAEPVSAYHAGQIEAHAATVYIGSSYGEALPAVFVAEAQATRRPLMWIGYGVEALVGTAAGQARYGWTAGPEDMSDLVTGVDYKGERFTRQTRDNGGLVEVRIARPERARTLATAIKADGRTGVWAVRSDNLIYVAENPFTYMSESDRYLVFADLMFDLLAPQTPPRRRALVRIEDVGPNSDPARLRAVADYLAAEHAPFAVAVYDSYRDPLGRQGPRRLDLAQAPAVVAALRYMQARGGTLIMHGHTHQFAAKLNPYSAVSADDFEFFLAHVSPTGYVTYDGPLQGDSEARARARMNEGLADWAAAGLARPTIFEFPHYAASAADYCAAGELFAARYDRALYFAGVLSGRPVDPRTWGGQFFPYPVTDVYGARVLPENLGNHEPVGFNHNPARGPKDILAAARRNLVMRDVFASFYHHPFLDIALLKQTVAGLKAQGYVFVSVESVLADP
jgi:uncharacterized protein YdaL